MCKCRSICKPNSHHLQSLPLHLKALDFQKKSQLKTCLAGIDGHCKGCTDRELKASPLKSELLNVLWVESNPWDVDISLAMLGILVADSAVQDLIITIFSTMQCI